MKLLSLLLFLFLYCLVHSQISLSAGFNRKSENNPGLEKHFAFKTKKNDAIYNYVYLKGQFKDKHLGLDVEISMMEKDVSISHARTDYFGGGSSPTYRNVYTFSASTQYGYVGLKLGGSYIFEGPGLIFKKANASIGLGAFFQADFLTYHRESRHFSTLEKYNNSNVEHKEVQTYSGSSEEKFDALYTSKTFQMIGLQLNRKVSFQHVFFEFNLAAGFFFNSRTVILHTDGEKDYRRWQNLFVDTGLGIGYVFN